MHEVLGGGGRSDEAEDVLAQVDVMRLERRLPGVLRGIGDGGGGRSGLRVREYVSRGLRHGRVVVEPYFSYQAWPGSIPPTPPHDRGMSDRMMYGAVD